MDYTGNFPVSIIWNWKIKLLYISRSVRNNEWNKKYTREVSGEYYLLFRYNISI